MKRFISALAFVLLLLSGCTGPDKMPVFTDVNLDHFGGVGFAEDGKTITYATLTVKYVSPSPKQIEIKNVIGRIHSKDGGLVATISIPVGDVIVLKPESEDSFTQTINVKMEGSILKMLAGGLALLQDGTLDVEADVCYGNHNRHFSKRGIPIEDMIRNYNIKTGK